MGLTYDKFSDGNSPSRRTKKQIMNQHNPELPDYIKTPYPILNKKQNKEMEVVQFNKFMDMLTKIHVNIPLCKAPE